MLCFISSWGVKLEGTFLSLKNKPHHVIRGGCKLVSCTMGNVWISIFWSLTHIRDQKSEFVGLCWYDIDHCFLKSVKIFMKKWFIITSKCQSVTTAFTETENHKQTKQRHKHSNWLEVECHKKKKIKSTMVDFDLYHLQTFRNWDTTVEPHKLWTDTNVTTSNFNRHMCYNLTDWLYCMKTHHGNPREVVVICQFWAKMVGRLTCVMPWHLDKL